MNISLTSKIEKWIQKRVKDGGYTGASEVIREVIREKIESEEKQGRLRQELDAGIGAGLEQAKRGQLLEGKEVFNKLRRRTQAYREKHKAA